MILDNLHKYKVILASKSPRRQELLGLLGVSFEVIMEKEIEEDFPLHLFKEQVALYLADKKAKAFLSKIKENELIITADTIVICGDTILNKPVDREDALRMLKLLSGKTHEVITGVCILTRHKKVLFHASTKVQFALLTQEEIEYYVDQYKPFDKAGAYGIQEWIGLAAITNVEGSYYNVVGLPVQRLYQKLKEF